jgi:hypothetical protein
MLEGVVCPGHQQRIQRYDWDTYIFVYIPYICLYSTVHHHKRPIDRVVVGFEEYRMVPSTSLREMYNEERNLGGV